MKRTLSDALILAWKDLQQLRRNRMAILLSLILLPGFFMATLVAAQGQKQSESIETQFLSIAVADQDGTVTSRAFRQALAQSEHLGRVWDTSTREAGELLLRKGTVAVVVLLPKGFEDSVRLGRRASILIIVDDSKPGIPEGAYLAILEIAQQYSSTLNYQTTGNVVTGALQLVRRGRPFSHLEIGIGIMLGFVQVFAGFFEVAGGMVRERERGTFPRLILAKASRLSIMLGKTIYSSLLTLGRGVVVVAIAIYGYGATIYGNVPLVILVSWAMGLAAMGLALVLAALRVGGRIVVISEFLLVIVLFAFGGLFRDRDLMSGPALLLSNLLPWTYGFDALRKTIILGWGFERILPELGILALYSIGFYAIALALFQRRRESLIA